MDPGARILDPASRILDPDPGTWSAGRGVAFEAPVRILIGGRGGA
jgi:hypothetical protein